MSDNKNIKSTEVEKLAELLHLAASKGLVKKCVFSMPTDSSVKKAEASVKLIGEKRMLQLETFLTDGKAVHLNINEDDVSAVSEFIEGFLRINLITSCGTCEYRATLNGSAKLIGGTKLSAELLKQSSSELSVEGNDRQKNRILKGNEPFLTELGVCSPDGRIHDKKQPKFRQICRFLEHIREIECHLPAEGTIRICDLCCGKSYLSFAVYHYFSVIRQRNVSMTGVDLKPDVIEYCRGIAKRLSFDGLEFICGDVAAYDSRESGIPHLVVSLHACDIATDIVIDKAAAWGTPVILSTPCCHHTLASRINCSPLSFVTEHSFLNRKLCDVLTDAARLKRLEASGYSVSATELTDPDDTPKNVLIRAISDKNISPARLKKSREEYDELRRFMLGMITEEGKKALPDIPCSTDR